MISKYYLTAEEQERCYNQALMQCLFEVNQSQNPKMVYVAAQPGAGKTGVAMKCANELRENNEKYAEISADKIATFHKYYDELLKVPPNVCYEITRSFTKVAIKKINEELTKAKANMISESTFNNVEKYREELPQKLNKGYEVNVNILAVDKYESLASCHERDLSLVEKGLNPRAVYRGNHDRVYDGMLDNISVLYEENLISQVNVYRRGEVEIEPELISSFEKGESFEEIITVVQNERKMQREKLFAEKDKYLIRLEEVKRSIAAKSFNPILVKNVIEDIAIIQQEFIEDYEIYAMDREKNVDKEHEEVVKEKDNQIQIK